MDLTSDIDVLLIGHHRALEAQKVITQIQKQLNREINTIDMTPEDFLQRKRDQDPFIIHVFNNPHLKLDL